MSKEIKPDNSEFRKDSTDFLDGSGKGGGGSGQKKKRQKQRQKQRKRKSGVV